LPVVAVVIEGGQALQIDNNTTSTTPETNGSFGEQISAFVQTSAVDTNSSVETRIFNAAVNTSTAPEREVTTQAKRLERQLTRLQERAARLQDKRANRTLPDVACAAKRVRFPSASSASVSRSTAPNGPQTESAPPSPC
jgi:hypothetical protein